MFCTCLVIPNFLIMHVLSGKRYLFPYTNITKQFQFCDVMCLFPLFHHVICCLLLHVFSEEEGPKRSLHFSDIYIITPFFHGSSGATLYCTCHYFLHIMIFTYKRRSCQVSLLCHVECVCLFVQFYTSLNVYLCISKIEEHKYQLKLIKRIYVIYGHLLYDDLMFYCSCLMHALGISKMMHVFRE